MAESSSQQTYKRRKENPRSLPAPPPTIDESIPPSSSIHVRRFSSPAKHQEFLKTMATRKLLVERQFLVQVLLDVKFKFLDNFVDWGWMQLLDMKGVVYPNLVRLFYFNGDCTHVNDDDERIFGRDHQDDFTTTVLGQTFVVDEDLVREHLEQWMKEEGATCIDNDFNYENACATIFNNPEMTWQENNTSLMDFQTRLLHLIVGHTLLPKGGSYADLSKRDKFFLSKVIDEDPPNLPALMVRRMIAGVVHCKTPKNKMGLPYAILVSRIVKAECGNLIHKTETTGYQGTEPFDYPSLGFMGYDFNKTTKVLTKKPPRKKKNKEPIDDNPPQDDAMFMASMMEDIKAMNEANMKKQEENMEEMRGMFAKMDARYQAQEAHLLSQDAQIRYLHDSMRAQANEETYDIPFPTYHPLLLLLLMLNFLIAKTRVRTLRYVYVFSSFSFMFKHVEQFTFLGVLDV